MSAESNSFRIHPLTLQFADADEEARFRKEQMLSHLPVHFTLATSAIVLALVGSVMEPQLTDVYLWWLPFIVSKYPLLWWLTRDGGKNAQHASLVLGTNMFCFIASQVVRMHFFLRPEGRAGGSVAGFINAAAYLVFTLQSHFYLPFRERWAMWCLFLAVKWNHPRLLDMPKRQEFALILLVAMIGVMISFSFDRSHRLMQRDLLRYVQLNMQLERAELERKARKVLNHTSKRVMANAAQASDLALELLDAGEAAPTEAELEQARHLLRQVLAEARGGYRMAQSVITSAAPSRSRQLKRFTIRSLFDDIGLSANRRILLGAGCNAPLLCDENDREKLGVIVFNAGQNALIHGESEGEVEVLAALEEVESSHSASPAASFTSSTASTSDSFNSSSGVAKKTMTRRTLVLRISNGAGQNHARLLALKSECPFDMFRIDQSALPTLGVGTELSTFQGLADMQQAAHAVALDEMHLWVRRDGLTFELRMSVHSPVDDTRSNNDDESFAMVEDRTEASFKALAAAALVPDDDIVPMTPPTPSRKGACSSPLPKGLVLVQCDDDEIARIAAHRLVDVISADASQSITLGATHEEAYSVPDVLARLAEGGVPASQTLLILDQHMDYDEGSIEGTTLCRRLRSEMGWDGVIIIRSANDESAAQAEYLAAGADGVMGKGMDMMASQPALLAKLYYRRYPCAG